MIQTFCSWLMKRLGWQFTGPLPTASQYIMIVGPHTSNWDFILGIIARAALGQQIRFLGKHQLFIPPWGWLFRAMGGSPVDRRKNNNLVDGVVALFEADPAFKLALAPEGTRSPVKRWKTGFYHIATKANVPIVAVGLDFKHKHVVLNPAMHTTGDIEADMTALLTFYRAITGRHPKVIPDYIDEPKH